MSSGWPARRARWTGEPLLTCVVKGGARQQPPRVIHEIRDACQTAVARLPEAVRRHRDAAAYPVVLSVALEQLAAGVASELSARGGSSARVDTASRSV